MRFDRLRALALAVAITAAGPAPLPAQQSAAGDSVMVTHVSDSAIYLGPRLSLTAVILRTAAYSPGLDSAAGTVRTSRSTRRVAVGAYLPSVAATGMAGRSDQGVASAGTTTATGPQGAYGAGVSATLALFTGGRRSAVRHEAAAAARAADAGFVSQRYATRLLAMTGYFEVLRGHELVRVGNDAVGVAEKSLAYTRARGAAGTATRSDVLRAQLALSTAQRILLASQDTLTTAAAALGRLVGADGLVDAEPMTLHPVPLALNDSAVVEAAVRDAPVVQQAQAQVTLTGASVQAAKAQYAPTIFASGGYNWSNDGRVTGAPRQGWLVELGASFVLFNGFVREDSVIRARVAADVATSTAADTRRFSRAESLRLLGSLGVAEQDVGLTMEEVRVATEDLRVIASRYRAGIATILDLITSQQALLQAELDLVSARFTYQTTRATLEALLGREL